MANEAVELAVGLARRFEGLFLKPYLDPVGVPTTGYGFTRYADGRRVRLDDPPITREAAEVLLWSFMAETQRRVIPLIGHDAAPTLTTGRLAALSDFAYNLGVQRLAASTLLRCARVGRWAACPTELRKWRMAGGRVLPGLVLRREAEIVALLN